VKYLVLALVFGAGYAAAQLTDVFAADPKPAPPAPVAQQGPSNPNIDIEGYLVVAKSAADHRASRRLTEDEFIKMSREEGVIVLDARSKEKFDLLHIKGAINLSFPDIDVASLKKVLPDKNVKILIYCNNNFVNTPVPPGAQVPVQVRKAPEAFPSKLPAASLNISTYVALYNYGYRNVYELGPLVDPAKSKLTFESNKK
jgi:phage shock protein E